MVLVDTNVILDVIEEDLSWADWSQEQLDRAAMNGALLINPVIYAELSIAFQRIEEQVCRLLPPSDPDHTGLTEP